MHLFFTENADPMQTFKRNKKKKEQNCSLPVLLLMSHWQEANATVQ